MSLYPMPCKDGMCSRYICFFFDLLFQIHFPRGTFSVWKPDAFCVHQSNTSFHSPTSPSTDEESSLPVTWLGWRTFRWFHRLEKWYKNGLAAISSVDSMMMS